MSALVLLFLMGFLYSPWHKHFGSKVCPFSGLDHAGLEEPVAGAILSDPGACASWQSFERDSLSRASLRHESTGSRAPPSWQLA